MTRHTKFVITTVAALALGVGAASAGAHSMYSWRATKPCLLAHHVKWARAKASESVIDAAPGGAFNLTLRHNDLGISFYRSAARARSGLSEAKAYFKSIGVPMASNDPGLYVRNNVLVGWDNDPTKIERQTIEGCLR